MSDLITLESGEVLDLAAYPLPEGVEDEVFNLDLMAKAMATSTVTVSRWIDQGMPVQQRGGNGQSYELRFSHCFAWRKWKEASDTAARRALESKAEQKAMLFLNEDTPTDGARLSPKEVREWSEAELIRNKAAQQRGELVRTHQVVEMLEHVLATARNAMLNAPDWLEQEFSLSPGQVDKAQRYFDGVLEEMRHQMVQRDLMSAELIPLSGAGDRSQG